MASRFVWVDIPVTDLQRAVRFYSAVIGMDVAVQDMPGFKFAIFPHEGADVGGCLVPVGDGNAPSGNGPLVYVNVEGRMKQAVEAATANGGRVVEPAHSIGPHGFRAVVIDSEGNRVALHAMKM
jgi:predicted enzyme related to lactoylglutathione lyase